MASQERAVAVASVGLQLLTSGHAWLGEGRHCLPELGERGAGLVGRHMWSLWRRFGRQFLL